MSFPHIVSKQTFVLNSRNTGIKNLDTVLKEAGLAPSPSLNNVAILKQTATILKIKANANLFHLSNVSVGVVFEEVTASKGPSVLAMHLFCNLIKGKPGWKFSDSFPDMLSSGSNSMWSLQHPPPAPFLDDLKLVAPFFVVTTQAFTYQEQKYGVGLPWNMMKMKVGLNFISKLTLATAESANNPLAPVAELIGTSHALDISGHIQTQGKNAQIGLSAALDLDLGFANVRIKQVSLSFVHSLSGGTNSITLGLSVALSEQFQLKLSADISQGLSGTLVIRGAFDPTHRPTLPSFGELAALFGGTHLAKHLPKGLQEPTDMGLNAMRVDLDLNQKKITYAKVDIGTSAAWDWLAGNLGIANIDFEWEVFFRKKIEISLLISGEMIIGGGHVSVAAAIPDIRKLSDYQLMGALAEGETISISDLFTATNPRSSRPASAPGDHDVDINRLHLRAYPAKKYYSFDVDIENAISFKIGKTPLAVTNATLALNSDGDYTLAGYFLIAGVHIALVADHTPEAGWRFQGTAKQIDIGALLTDLGTYFKITDIPPIVQSFSIEKFYVSFNTKSKDFSFELTGTLTLDSAGKIAPAATISIDLNHQGAGVYKDQFSGFVTVAGLKFSLIFDRQGGSSGGSDTKIAALFHDKTGLQFSVDDLLTALTPSLQPPITGLSFTLKDALFAADAVRSGTPGSAKTTTSYIFGLSIDGGLNLSALQNLPVVGKFFDRDETLSLDFEALYDNNAPLTAQAAAAFNALIGTHGLNLPAQGITKKLDLSTKLHLGAESHLISLPVALKVSKTKGTPSALTGSNDRTLPTGAPSAHTGQSSAAAVGNDGAHWFKIGKSFGPVHFDRIGLNYKDKKITGLLDASLDVSGLTISLDGLSVESALHPIDPHFGLHGLGINYQKGDVRIGSIFLEMGRESFAGLATVHASALRLSAIGQYGQVQGKASMFIYAVLDIPLGGPEFFFVEGIAGGFGYNRSLKAPPISQVAQFPLVAEAVSGPAPLPKSMSAGQGTLMKQLNALNKYITGELGEYFFAIGIKFTSFDLVNSFALVVVQLGERFELDLFGLSTAVIPPDDDKDPIAEAQLALEAVFIPSEGILQVSAQLTSASFLLSHNCHLTGGFAFYLWFKGAHSGDFVLTLGGYNKLYHVPSNYPHKVPRLGFNWQISKEFFIKGGLYFALTPHAIMAGGDLQATFKSSSVKAWFKAGADFLIMWKPHHYDAHLYIDIGAKALGFSIDAGADLHLWGPSFTGKAHVHVSVIGIKIHFTISFGKAALGIPPIAWSTFKDTFLPKDSAVCTLSIQDGLIKQTEDTRKDPVWIVNPKELSIVTNSSLPLNNAKIATAVNAGGTVTKRQTVLSAATNALAFTPEGEACAFTSVGRHELEYFMKQHGITVIASDTPAQLVSAIGSNTSKYTVAELRAFLDQRGVPYNKKTDTTVPKLIACLSKALPFYQPETGISQTVVSPGVRPVGVMPEELTSTQTITIVRDGEIGATDFRFEPVFKPMPAALWATPEIVGANIVKPKTNEHPRLLHPVVAGFAVKAKKPLAPDHTQDITKGNLQYETEPVGEAYRYTPVNPFTAKKAASEEAAWAQVTEAAIQNGLKKSSAMLSELGFDPADPEAVSLGQSVNEHVLFPPMIEQRE